LLYDAIAAAIDACLAGSKVLGRKSLTQGWYEVDLQVGCRLVVVYYSEDMRGNVRWVESISVDRKPIIF